MKILWICTCASFLLVLTFCKESNHQQSANDLPKLAEWAGAKVDMSQLTVRKDSFVIFDPSGAKVGTMQQHFSYQDGFYKMEDISRFDDESVVEYAVFLVDSVTLSTRDIDIDMKTKNGDAMIKFSLADQLVKGQYQLSNEGRQQTIEVDSTYEMDISRNELYMLVNAVEWEEGLSLPLNIFAPLSMKKSKASLRAIGEEELNWQGKSTSCMKVELRSDGNIPDNDFWITRTSPRQILKVDVVGLGLEIKLAKSAVSS